MAKKKRIKENDYQVNLQSNNTNDPQTTKTLQAGTPTDAINNALKGDPNASQYNSVTVSKTKLPQPQPTQPNQQSLQQNPQNNMMESIKKNVDYPFVIVLPYPYKSLIETAMPNAHIIVRNNQLKFKILSESEMHTFLNGIMKNKNSPKANSIITSLKEFIK